MTDAGRRHAVGGAGWASAWPTIQPTAQIIGAPWLPAHSTAIGHLAQNGA
jgi:hypothetical protein